MQYPIVTSYVKDWDSLTAARELISNNLDGKNGTIEFVDGVLVLTNKNFKLDKKTLLLGHSEKGGKAIGQYGEGMKLAALVLCRDNIEFSFQNADEMWCWSIAHSKALDAEVLQMHRKKCTGTDLIIKIHGLDEVKVRGRCLALQDTKVLHDGSYGQILDLPERGHIFVGGQWVFQSGCRLNYNFPVGVVPMNRDRGVLDAFHMRWHMRDILAHPDLEEIREKLILADETDIAGFEARPIKLSNDLKVFISSGGNVASGRFVGMSHHVTGRALVACSAPKKINVAVRLRKFLESYKGDMHYAMLESFNQTFEDELK